jgi:hypothetical protein
MKLALGLRLAVIVLIDGLFALTGTPCSVNGPACGLTIFDVPPSDFQISLDDPINQPTLQASDFTVNGVPAASSKLLAGQTIVIFHFNRSPAVQGTNVMHIAPGAFSCLTGPVSEYRCIFYFVPSRW